MAEEKSALAPQKAPAKYTPLSELTRMAVRRYGDSTSRISDDVQMMFMEFANRVVEDIRVHPYWSSDPLDYYTSANDVRPIPDMIMVDGLVAHYAIQQGSQKMDYLGKLYFRTLNQTLYERKYGNLPVDVIQVDFDELPADNVASVVVNATSE